MYTVPSSIIYTLWVVWFFCSRNTYLWQSDFRRLSIKPPFNRRRHISQPTMTTSCRGSWSAGETNWRPRHNTSKVRPPPVLTVNTVSIGDCKIRTNLKIKQNILTHVIIRINLQCVQYRPIGWQQLPCVCVCLLLSPSLCRSPLRPLSCNVTGDTWGWSLKLQIISGCLGKGGGWRCRIHLQRVFVTKRSVWWSLSRKVMFYLIHCETFYILDFICNNNNNNVYIYHIVEKINILTPLKSSLII